MTRHAIIPLSLLLLLLAACQEAPAPAEAAPAIATLSPVERGQYLVDVGGCHDCHTPWTLQENGPGPDLTRALSGHPADLEMPDPPAPVGPWIVASAATNTAHAGPWGVSFTANLTPHDETGLGTWTTETFIATIRNGRHMGRGRPLLPPMPYFNYAKATDEDLAAIFAYLQTVPAIDNRVPSPRPPRLAQAQ